MPHGILEWDLDQLQHAMHLNVDDVRAYFTDGRRVSFMLERRLMREVLGGRLATSEGDDHDLVDAQDRKWEVRSVSGGGIYFCPSYMVGSGRRFGCEGFLRKLGMIHGYVVSDITQFPESAVLAGRVCACPSMVGQGETGLGHEDSALSSP
jgi:hypothetical protein